MFKTLRQSWCSVLHQLSTLADIAHYVNLIKNGQSIATGDNEVLTRIYTGQLIYVDRRDLSVAPHLMMSGLWEFEITEIFRRYVKADTVLFDVGANLGYFGLVAGTYNHQGQLHFFDANPAFAPLIRKSLSVNGLPSRATVTTAAITAQGGEPVTLNLCRDHWGSASLHPIAESEFVQTAEAVTVPSLTLDDYCADRGINRVDLIKLDIEGYEEQAVQGMPRLLEDNPQLVIFMEYTYGAYSEDFVAFLQARFRISAIVGWDLVEVRNQTHLEQLGEGWIMLVLEPPLGR